MKGHILIVEDEKDTVELLRYNLEREGWRTEVTHNGNAAIESCLRCRPDVVLLDIMMPGMDGWEVCRELRGKDNALPVIMLTALSEEDDRIKGLTTGADDYVSKPFSIRELLLKVKRHAEKGSLLRAAAGGVAESDSLDYIVHELKNSLSCIEGYSKLSMNREDGGRYIPYIRESARHMDEILSDAHFLSMLERGDEFAAEPVNITEEIRKVVEIFREEALEKGIKITILAEGPADITGNRTAARQVLLNLLSNAVKYNRPGGKVMVWAEDEGEFVEIYVRDTGVGIRPEDLPRIFEKRYRAGGCAKVKGSGLGLYIVDLLMKAMGGNIKVASREGRGSTFTASFRKA